MEKRFKNNNLWSTSRLTNFIWTLIILMYIPVFFDLYRLRWSTIDYTHAYYVLPISLWLCWLKRKDLRQLKAIKLNLWEKNLFIFIFGLIIFLIGKHWDYLFLTTLSLIPVLFGLIRYIYGEKFARILNFPIFYLLLLVPPPLGILDSITIPMRFLISSTVESALKLLNIPFWRDGLLFSINGHEIYIAAPCSGLRSLITMFSLALVFTYFNKGTFLKKFFLIISVIPLAFIGNFMRIFGLCSITYFFNENIAKVFHDISGYIIFLFLIIMLFAVDNLLEKFKSC